MNLSLFGSGEFTHDVNEIDQHLISKFSLKNIAVLPTAAGLENDAAKWISMAQEHYVKFNVKVVPVPIFNNSQSNDSKLVNLLDDVDWIFFSGGNPGYLLETVKDSKLWAKVMKLYESGVLLCGSSAGAMIMGNYVLSPPFNAYEHKSETIWQDAFGLINYSIIPHFDHFKKNSRFIEKIIDSSPDRVRSSWMGIDENTAIIYSNNNREIKGLGGVEINDSTGIYQLD